MGYSRFSILKDVNNKPVPQYWNPIKGRYEVVESSSGKLSSVLVDNNGNFTHTQGLVDQINNQLIELVKVVEDIGL